jgi:hypothetical protein
MEVFKSIECPSDPFQFSGPLSFFQPKFNFLTGRSMATGGMGSARIPKENTSTSVIDTLIYSIDRPYNGVQR